MSGILHSIEIRGIHGNKNRTLKATIKNNTLIIVGENGSGKTTFLRILFHFLSGRWLALYQFSFDTITAKIDNEEFTVDRTELSRGFEKIDRRFLTRYPLSVRRRIMQLMETGQSDRVPAELERIGFQRYASDIVAHQRDLFEIGSSIGSTKEMNQKIHKLREIINAQVLYLPTFRRIERELGSIFEGVDPEDLRRKQNEFAFRDADEACIELVEFGMKDVQKAIDRSREKIKEFARQNLNSLTLKYLGDVVNEEYKKVGPREFADASEETVKEVLGRIDETILTPMHKEHLSNVMNKARSSGTPNEHDQIICHYFLKLKEFQTSLQEKEKSIAAFGSLCSEYIRDKRFIYDRATFEFSISSIEGEKNIELSELSSGEKQIVSLFSHLYLSGMHRFFVLIDEPELSLSVPWQRRFLADIRKGSFCAGLIAVTHSPFIFENELREYAHSLGEFTTF